MIFCLNDVTRLDDVIIFAVLKRLVVVASTNRRTVAMTTDGRRRTDGFLLGQRNWGCSTWVCLGDVTSGRLFVGFFLFLLLSAFCATIFEPNLQEKRMIFTPKF